MGHSTPHLTMTVYARVMERRDGEPDRLRALVAGEPLTAPTERAGEAAA